MNIQNVGAPRFLFDEDNVKIKLTLEIDIYDEAKTQKWLTLNLHEIMLDCDMWLEDMSLNLKWNSVSMDSAEIKSDLIKVEDNGHAAKKLENYFNWAF